MSNLVFVEREAGPDWKGAWVERPLDDEERRNNESTLREAGAELFELLSRTGIRSPAGLATRLEVDCRTAEAALRKLASRFREIAWREEIKMVEFCDP